LIGILVKSRKFGQKNQIFGQKIKLLVKIELLVKHQNFGKINQTFGKKIELLVKNRNFCQK